MDQQITVIEKDVSVTLHGRIEQQQATELKDKLLGLTGSGCLNFTVDFENVEYIDSSGLGMLVAVRNQVLSNGGFVHVVNLSGKMKRLFELTCLIEIFTE
ncbi:MAG: STAS domain-containing protein [Pelosinus sp.]|nr:STAS domain-containing protein [Pelosinus sp.]